jgi:alpha-galactosidase
LRSPLGNPPMKGAKSGPVMLDFEHEGVRLRLLDPVLEGEVPAHLGTQQTEAGWRWPLENGGAIELSYSTAEGITRLSVTALGIDQTIQSLGLRFSAIGVHRYLRNGYHSWDGSYFADPGTPQGDGPPEKAPTLGFAMTALIADKGALLVGFERHDRFQNRFRFGGQSDEMLIDAETLLDQTGAREAEPLLILSGDEVEGTLRHWSSLVAKASPLPPRIPKRRITGWCSWYNLYASITEENILEHLHATRHFCDAYNAFLDIFLIDDGFTPEMGDWLELKPQFPRGMAPLLADIRGQGFTPGLWIAPFMVGNRSKFFAAHPDWVVQDRQTGGPLIQMRFYGEFRWHKRSEEYYILDFTHPDAEAYVRHVFRTWARDWGAGYFKTDFMFHGAEYGPDRAHWHQPGLSRIAIWRRMASLIREEIGDALWLGCGCPLWASVGLVDAVRIGRDVGVKWSGEQSAESLLRDQATRNHAANILWQADPDCVLLRDQFHELTDVQVRSLAMLAGLTGGVLMTSDKLDEIPVERARLFCELLSLEIGECSYPLLGTGKGDILPAVKLSDGGMITLALDPASGESERTGNYSVLQR